MTLTNLKNYIKESSEECEVKEWYENEHFCLCTFDYLAHKGEFLKEDEEYLKENGYYSDDFLNDF